MPSQHIFDPARHREEIELNLKLFLHLINSNMVQGQNTLSFFHQTFDSILKSNPKGFPTGLDSLLFCQPDIILPIQELSH